MHPEGKEINQDQPQQKERYGGKGQQGRKEELDEAGRPGQARSAPARVPMAKAEDRRRQEETDRPGERVSSGY